MYCLKSIEALVNNNQINNVRPDTITYKEGNIEIDMQKYANIRTPCTQTKQLHCNNIHKT